MEHWDTISSERRALADDLEGLSAEQWETPSLCGDWTVRQLAGHLVVTHQTSLPKFFVEVAKARGSFDRANSRMARREGERSPADLIADLRRVAESRFKPPGFGSEAPLTDILIHGFDARVPLGLDSTRPSAPFRHVLDMLVSKKAQLGFRSRALPPLRFVATDVDWSHGNGEEVTGSAGDLALAMSGRRARLDQLAGRGAPTFVLWVSD